MKILYICDTLITFILNEIIEIKNQGHDVVILSQDSKGIHDAIIKPILKENGLENSYVRFNSFTSRTSKYSYLIKKVVSGFIKYPFRTMRAVYYIMRNNSHPKYGVVDYIDIQGLIGSGVEVIHSPFSTPRIIDKTYMLARILNIPFTLAFRAHDLYEGDNTVQLKERLDHISESSSIMTISDYNRTHLKNTLSIRNDVEVIHSSINPEFFKPSSSGKESGSIITVCRLHEQKGLDDLIKACQILMDRGVNYKCTIIGEGPEKDNLDRFVKEYSVKNVTFIDFLKYDEVVKYLSNSEVFVLPCVVAKDGKRDILANSLKEAMSMELPVITTNISGIEELVDDGQSGILVPPHNPEELADAIEYIFTNPKKAKSMGIAGRKKIEKDFSTVSEALKLESIFREVTERPICSNSGQASDAVHAKADNN